MPVIVITLAGAVDFDGLTPATGLVVWTSSSIPATTRVAIQSFGYHGAAGDAVSRLEFWLVDPAGPPTARILIGVATAAELVSPSGETDFSSCGRIVPRNASGAHWRLEVITTGKSQTASVTVDWTYSLHPDSGPNDARV